MCIVTSAGNFFIHLHWNGSHSIHWNNTLSQCRLAGRRGCCVPRRAHCSGPALEPCLLVGSHGTQWASRPACFSSLAPSHLGAYMKSSEAVLPDICNRLMGINSIFELCSAFHNNSQTVHPGQDINSAGKSLGQLSPWSCFLPGVCQGTAVCTLIWERYQKSDGVQERHNMVS